MEKSERGEIKISVWDRYPKTQARMDWDAKPADFKEMVELKRKEMCISGVETVSRVNKFDASKYEKYYKIMAENDVQGARFQFDIAIALNLREKWPIEKRKEYFYKALDKIKGLAEDYELIDIDKLNEETGKDIVIEYKDLIQKLIAEMEKINSIFADNSLELPKDCPVELKIILDRMSQLREQYSDLPAYVAYRFVGVYELDREFVPEHRQVYN